MSCRVKREMIGDILVGSGKTVVFVFDTVCDFLVLMIKKIGLVGAELEICDGCNIVVHEFTEIFGTVASLRLDGVWSSLPKLAGRKYLI